MWCCTPVISAPRRLRQEDLNFQANLGNTVRPCLKKTKPKPNKIKQEKDESKV
jgi:hypothetical protein